MAKNKRGKVTATAASLAVLALTLLVNYISAAEKEQRKDHVLEYNAEWTSEKAMTNPDSNTLVIYFSRSGNTEKMAQEIAKYDNAQLVHLESADYRPGFLGLVNAMKDSRSNRAVIKPATLDLSRYQTIFIGAPIWWYSPAPPVWQFVENNNLVDKNVVLFTTFNSSFEQKYIDEFQAQVEGKGGHFVKHIYVERGRITQQVSDNALLEQTRKALNNLQYE